METSYYKNMEPFWGSWKITRLIGEGSFGKVFEIEREDFGRTYKAALKAITIPQSESEVKSVLADGMDMQSATTYYRGFVEEVVDEFALMAQLKGNSNIVSYEDHTVVEHKDGIGWDILIRMELLTPLLDYTTERKMTQNDILKLGIDICKALEYCKNFNIIHRDIKPENIFISPSGDYKLGDFGIARTAEKTTSGMSKKGTYTYMAPEVYKGQSYGPSVDIYSLGIVLYRLANNNRAPFLPDYPAPISHIDRENSITRRIRGEQIPAPLAGDERLIQIILKACAYLPENRYGSPEEMRRDLEALLTNHQEVSRSETSYTVNPVIGHVMEKTAQNPALTDEPEQRSMEPSAVAAQPQQTSQPQWDAQPQQTSQPQWGEQSQQTGQPQWDTSPPQDLSGEEEEDGTVFLFGDESENIRSKETAPVRQEPVTRQQQETDKQPEKAGKEKKKGNKTPLLIGGGIAAAAVIGIVIGASRMSGGSYSGDYSYSGTSNVQETGGSAAPDSTEDTGVEETGSNIPGDIMEAGSDAAPADEGSGEPIADSEVGYFNELLFGTFKMEPADSSGAEGTEIVEGAVQFEYNESYDTEFFIFPEELNGMSANQNYCEDVISYSGENFYPNTKENQADLFADWVHSDLDYDDLEAAKAFYEEHIAGTMDVMELTFADKAGDLYEDTAYYKIADGQLTVYRPALDETDPSQLSLQSVAYDISRDNYTFRLSRDGLSAEYAPDGFQQSDSGIAKWFNGYASSPEDVYQGISYMRLSTYPEAAPTNAAPEIYFTDGTCAVSPAAEFTGDNTVTVSWESKASMLGGSDAGTGEASVIEEPGFVTFRYIPNPEVGFILIGSDGVYKYQKTYEQYFYDALGSNLDSSLSQDGKISSVGETELLQLQAIQSKIEAQLADAFAAQNINVKMDNGVIALDSSILFGLDDAQLSEEGKAYLDAFVDAFWSILADDSDYAGYISAIVVEGFTDSSGDDDYNMQLSLERAMAVVDYCGDREVIMLMFLQPEGGGSTNLIYDETGAEDREASRRVEFRIIF